MLIRGKNILVLVSTLIFIIVIVPILLNRKDYVYDTSNPHSSIELESLGSKPGWILDRLDVDPGIYIPGLIHIPEDKNTEWIIYFPGNGSGQLAGGQEYLERLSMSSIASKKWGLTVWGMRGYDNVDGLPDSEDYQSDLIDILNYIVDRYSISTDSIHLIGFSLGSDMAMLTAGRLKNLGIKPASIVLLSTQGLTKTKWSMRRQVWYAPWLPSDYYDLSNFFNSNESPVLVIESENDLYGDIEFLLNTIKGKVKYLELENGSHSFSTKSSRAIDETAKWIELSSK